MFSQIPIKFRILEKLNNFTFTSQSLEGFLSTFSWATEVLCSDLVCTYIQNLHSISHVIISFKFRKEAHTSLVFPFI